MNLCYNKRTVSEFFRLEAFILRVHTFLTLLLGASLALASFTTIISCNGNGGSSYSEGDAYTPGGSGGGHC